ncbi:PEP/pyruvate-binding domain-containing protein [Streptomyces sp. AN091965]|uniref:PEP/pyruvate-binding domain-containing protein n=1 Tax=Streptomyces sp. AN091965 TaxID=2927803 RepID=UPI001F607099|nr:PEP/pyruvate-binding domain-containing protein [Streptomyces sp. AN091965]MCI3928935.1 PEP-utilizing enzyme [Streptomyces sp. AN091965]
MIGVETDRLVVVGLEARHARDPRLTGAKAAHLARAAAVGLPVLPGFVLVPADAADAASAAHAVTAAVDAASAAGIASREGPAHGEQELRRAWRELSGDGARPLVVRSSSAWEDSADSSLAGLFETVLDVRGWSDFTDAVRRVLRSAGRTSAGAAHGGSAGRTSAGAGHGGSAGRAPAGAAHGGSAGRTPTGAAHGAVDPHAGMAVLVQPMVRATVGGVMFGADPMAGRRDRVVISAVDGGPDRLVNGSVQGVRYHLTRHGRQVHTEPGEPRDARLLARARQLRLLRLARDAQREFGGPQDIEFAFDADDRLWLFQTRPITAMPPRPARRARLLGPGPVAETFPGVLQPLEEDLWLAPMAHGLSVALDIAGAAPRRRLRRLPPVTTVDGRAAADLRLLGAAPPTHRLLGFLNPAPAARRATAAWRMGRVRTTLPALALDLTADVDRYLSELPAPAEMLSGRLLAAVSWGRTVLSALHAQESLAGAVLGQGSGATAVGEALAVLAEARADEPDDARLIARHPVLLSLLPPALGPRPPLPGRPALTGVPRGTAVLPAREGLRLRVRWVQEMQTSMVRELARRLTAVELLGDPDRIALLRWAELTAAGDGKGLPADLRERLPRPQRSELPAAFRLADGLPVAEPGRRRAAADGQGAGGGFGSGTAWHGGGERPRFAVLVVRALDPALAPLLPGLTGLVAETGSVLSHLAVLAREYQVPTAVGVPDALERFPDGTRLTVDGGTGAVEGVRMSAVAPPAAPPGGAGHTEGMAS